MVCNHCSYDFNEKYELITEVNFMSYILINSLLPGISSPLTKSLEHLFYNVLKILFIHMCKKSAGLVWSNYSNIHKVSKYILSILYLYKFVFI